jgi:Mg-chelatase subunit ChlI
MNDFQKALLKAKFDKIKSLESVKEQLKSALIANRHIILVGPPGTGKTTFAKEIAHLLPKKKDNFIRVQGSPDLTAEDLIGDIDPIKAMKFGPLSMEAFQKGKIFKAEDGILFFDEVNRCSEKLQNALLQALEEGFVTIGSYTVDLPVNFVFIGTMNPEDASTEDLSAVFLDRFDLINVGYPERDADETLIVQDSGIKMVDFPKGMLDSVVEFIRSFREHPDILRKPSVRASIGIYERAQANAVLNNRKKVSQEDIEKSIVSVLAHRMELKPSKKYLKSAEEFIEENLKDFIKKKGGGL